MMEYSAVVYFAVIPHMSGVLRRPASCTSRPQNTAAPIDCQPVTLSYFTMPSMLSWRLSETSVGNTPMNLSKQVSSGLNNCIIMTNLASQPCVTTDRVYGDTKLIPFWTGGCRKCEIFSLVDYGIVDGFKSSSMPLDIYQDFEGIEHCILPTCRQQILDQGPNFTF